MSDTTRLLELHQILHLRNSTGSAHANVADDLFTSLMDLYNNIKCWKAGSRKLYDIKDSKGKRRSRKRKFSDNSSASELNLPQLKLIN